MLSTLPREAEYAESRYTAAKLRPESKNWGDTDSDEECVEIHCSAICPPCKETPLAHNTIEDLTEAEVVLQIVPPWCHQKRIFC